MKRKGGFDDPRVNTEELNSEKTLYRKIGVKCHRCGIRLNGADLETCIPASEQDPKLYNRGLRITAFHGHCYTLHKADMAYRLEHGIGNPLFK